MFGNQAHEAIQKYPNLKFCQDHTGMPFLKGILDISNDRQQVVGNFLIEVKHSEKFPYRFPSLFETGGIIPNEPNWHKYDDGSCCVTVTADEILKCKNGITVSNFIAWHAVPYFANYIYRKQTGKYKNGEYAHGKPGVIQFYRSLMKTDDINLWNKYVKIVFFNHPVSCGRNDRCFCGSNTKFKLCHLHVFEDLLRIGKVQVLNDLKLIIT